MADGRIRIAVEPDLDRFPGKLESGLRGTTSAASRIGKGIGLALAGGTALAAVGLKQVIDVGVQYTGRLNELQAVTHATDAQMRTIGATAKALGSDMSLPATSAADAASAMLELAKGGLSVNDAMRAAKGTLQLAAAAQIEAAQAAEIQSQALNQFGLKASSAAHVADVLANTANAASGSIVDIAGAMKYVGPVARSLRVDIDSTATAIGLLANNGIQSEQAGTSLRAILASLSAPSKAAAKAMGALNIVAFDQQGKFVGLRAITAQLAAAKGKLTDAEFASAAATAFGNESLSAVNALANSGTKSFDAMAKAVAHQGGAAEVAAAKTKGLGGAIEGFKSQVETAEISIYEQIAPDLEAATRAGAQFVSDFTPKLVSGIGAVRGVVTGTGSALSGLGEIARGVVSDVEPLVEGAGHLAQGFARAGGPISLVRGALELTYDAALGTVHALSPVTHTIGDLAEIAGSLPGPIQSAALALALLRFGAPVLGKLRDALSGSASAADGAEKRTGIFGRTLGAVTAPARLAASTVGGAARAVRQLNDEARLQQALAAQSGQQVSRLGGAMGAYQTSTIGAVRATSTFTNLVGDVRRGAEGANAPLSRMGVLFAALAERSPGIAAIRESFLRSAQGADEFSARTGNAAAQATRSLGQSIPAAIRSTITQAALLPTRAGVAFLDFQSTASRALTRVAGDAVALPSRLAGAFESARSGVASRASGIVAAVQAIPTGIGLAAISAGERAQSLASRVSSGLRALPTAIGVGVIGALQRVPGAVQTGVSALSRLGTVAVSAGAAVRTGIARAATGLVGALGGPFGLAIAAASIGLGLLADANEKAAEQERQHQANVSDLASALRDTKGAVTDVIRAQVGLRLTDQFSAGVSGARQLGIGLNQVTDAVLKQGDAYNLLHDRLKAIVDASRNKQDFSPDNPFGFDEQGKAAFALLLTLEQLGGETDAARQKNKELSEAVANGTASYLDATDAGRTLAASMQTLGDNAANADDKARALKSGLDALSGGNLGLEAAQAQLNGQLSNLATGFQGLDVHAKGFAATLIDANGKINTTTEQGRRLFSGLQDISGSMAQVSQATFEASQAQGDDLATSLDKARAAAARARDEFVAQANKLGLTATQARRLADEYGLVPENVVTLIQTPGMSQAQRELILIRSLVNAVPPDKPVVVRTISSEAEAQLVAFGYKVTHLKDGRVQIIAQTASAQAALNNFVGYNNGRQINLSVVYRIPKGLPRGIALTNATGGLVKRFDDGGMANLRPMRGGIATIVPPNTWRVVGDRLRDDEAYIPLNRSLPRSHAILDQSARAMGYALVRQYAEGGVAAARNGSVATAPAVAPVINNNVQVRRDEDAMTVAQVVSANNAWQLRTRPFR